MKLTLRIFTFQTSFMLILLLLAKGWAVTRQQISKTSWFILMAIWIPYVAFHMVLYVWNRVRKLEISVATALTILSIFRDRLRWTSYQTWTNIKHGRDGWCWHAGKFMGNRFHATCLDNFVDPSRSCIMLWFLWELRNTMRYEHSSKKLDFLLHFGASSLVWFIYLPIVAVVALQVSPMWRYKLLLGLNAYPKRDN